MFEVMFEKKYFGRFESISIEGMFDE